jgi:hypothetical protein
MKLVCLLLRFALRIGQADRSGSQDPCVYGSAAPVRWHDWNAVRTSAAKKYNIEKENAYAEAELEAADQETG